MGVYVAIGYGAFGTEDHPIYGYGSTSGVARYMAKRTAPGTSVSIVPASYHLYTRCQQFPQPYTPLYRDKVDWFRGPSGMCRLANEGSCCDPGDYRGISEAMQRPGILHLHELAQEFGMRPEVLYKDLKALRRYSWPVDERRLVMGDKGPSAPIDHYVCAIDSGTVYTKQGTVYAASISRSGLALYLEPVGLPLDILDVRKCSKALHDVVRHRADTPQTGPRPAIDWYMAPDKVCYLATEPSADGINYAEFAKTWRNAERLRDVMRLTGMHKEEIRSAVTKLRAMGWQRLEPLPGEWVREK